MTKVAFFDIDKTIIKKDSMFLFLLFGIKKRPFTFYALFVIFVYYIIFKLKLCNIEKVKEKFFISINYMDQREIEEFYDDILLKYIYDEAIITMQKLKEEGYQIILVSASPYAYIKYFKKNSFVDKIIGTELEEVEGIYTNKILGRNCKGEEKVRRISEYLLDHDLTIDFDNSIAYSDCLSDLPMLSLVKKRYLINKDSWRKGDFLCL